MLGYEFYLIGGVPILSDNPDSIRTMLFGFGGEVDPRFDKLYIKLLHPLVDFIKYGIFLAIIVLCQKTAKGKRVILLSLVLIVLGTTVMVSQAGRVFFVNIAITGVVLFHYLRQRIRLAQFGAALMALFLFLGLFGSIRTKTSQSAPAYQRARDASGFPEGQVWDGAAFGYMTLTMSYEVFFRLTSDLQNIGNHSGGFLFYSLHRFIPRSDLGRVAIDLYTAESVTATFLGEFYADYGYWGVLFGPLVLGLGYGWAYSRADGRNTIYWAYVRALLIQMLIFFPYVNLFSHYLTWIFDLFFMYFLISRLTGPKGQQFPSDTANGLPVPLPA